MQSEPLDNIGTTRVLCALLEQAYIDVGSHKAEERESAMDFIQSHAFAEICKCLGLNERRIRRNATEMYENARTRPRKKWKRQPAAEKYQLG
jgi:hypothetical protein